MAAEEAAKRALASIKPVPPGSSPFTAGSLNKDQLRMLYFLFNKNLEKALRILDNRGVTRVTANPSGRVVFQVVAESKGLNRYTCFPEHFCSCPAFHFEVVSRGKELCDAGICDNKFIEPSSLLLDLNNATNSINMDCLNYGPEGTFDM